MHSILPVNFLEKKTFKDSFRFDAANNLLTLIGGAMSHVQNRQYEIYVTTAYFDIVYFQKVLINSVKPPVLPITSLGLDV
jgi:hypothetical protein